MNEWKEENKRARSNAEMKSTQGTTGAKTKERKRTQEKKTGIRRGVKTGMHCNNALLK